MSDPQISNPIPEGQPLDPELLQDFANIDIADIESASLWWDETASTEWVGALDSEPINNE